MECPFCEIVSNKSEEILQETRHSFVVLSNPRLVLGHMLVIPKRHVERLSDLPKEEQTDLFDEVIRVQNVILEKIATGCDMSQHYRPFIGQNRLKVNHLHIHLRPRELNDELYEKVQKYEAELFTQLEAGETEDYRKLLK